MDGYTRMVERMLEGIEVRTGVDYQKNQGYADIAKKVLYTGPIDAYYDYCFGELEYRSLRFETEVLEMDNYQGVAGMNFTDAKTPYTRIIEHKHFLFGQTGKDTLGQKESTDGPARTVITREYPAVWKRGDEPYYPINDERNMALYEKYRKKSQHDPNVVFAGRLGTYQYYDMDKVIAEVFKLAEEM